MQALIHTKRDTTANAISYELLRGWVPIIALPSLVLVLFPASLPRWAYMWTLAFATYCGCKWLTFSRTPVPEAPLWKHLSYWLAWPGLDAASFLSSWEGTQAARVSSREWLFAIAKLLLGLLLFFAGPRLVSQDYPYLIGWIGMIAIVMILHFGLFHLLSCAWRALGVNAQPLMNFPLASTSISEFWGRRWNTAFRDLTNRHVFRPLVPQLGVRGSLAIAFLLSGLVHELVISVPARGGYGGPTLFFLLQGLAVFASRTSIGRGIGLSDGRTGKLFAAFVLLGPAFLLFHRPFVFEIVMPFMKALGGI